MAVFLRLASFVRCFSSTSIVLPPELHVPASSHQIQKIEPVVDPKNRVECLLKQIDKELTRSSSQFRAAIDGHCWELAALIEKSPELREMLPHKLARYVDNFGEVQTKTTTDFYALRFDLNESELVSEESDQSGII